MDWWSVAATFFAAASLIAVVWQILRFEATRPPLGWHVKVEVSSVVTNGRRDARLSFRPMGPIVIHEVVAQVWGAATIEEDVRAPRMDCDSAPLSASFDWPTGQEAFGGFTWVEMSLIRRAPVSHGIRVSLPGGDPADWRWHRIPRLAARAQGAWIPRVPGHARRTFIPGSEVPQEE